MSTSSSSRWKLVCQPRHFVKHDIADSTIWSLDVEQTYAVIRYGLLYIYYVSQVLHQFLP